LLGLINFGFYEMYFPLILPAAGITNTDLLFVFFAVHIATCFGKMASQISFFEITAGFSLKNKFPASTKEYDPGYFAISEPFYYVFSANKNKEKRNPRRYLSTMRIYFVTMGGLVFNGSSMGLQWVLGKMKFGGRINA